MLHGAPAARRIPLVLAVLVVASVLVAHWLALSEHVVDVPVWDDWRMLLGPLSVRWPVASGTSTPSREARTSKLFGPTRASRPS